MLLRMEHRVLVVEAPSMLDLAAEIDRARTENPVTGVLHMSHAMCPDPKSPTGFRYSALIFVEMA
jgi:hypothetical protein